MEKAEPEINKQPEALQKKEAPDADKVLSEFPDHNEEPGNKHKNGGNNVIHL